MAAAQRHGVPPATAEAFDDLYRDSRERIASQLLVLTGNRQDSYDLVQEAFVRTWTRWERIARYDDPEAFVRRVAFNLAKNRWRTARRMVLRASPPERAIYDLDRTTTDAVLAALVGLSRNERAAIVLHHLAGLSVEEVAAELRAPPGTVKSWLARGRLRLADRLTKEGYRDA
jgi:RNA polymerase sigma-70 factor (ECF subfamily)